MARDLLKVVFYITICHSCISRDDVFIKNLQRNFQEDCNHQNGGNAYKNERVAYLRMT